tara:strand:+ start:741 stop:1016 length:276 start_codon:yes stop_codon:yes gene_type:complete
MENNMTKKRARTEDGKFIADDPNTPDVNEAFTDIQPEAEDKPEVPQHYVVDITLLNEIINILGQLNYKTVFQTMEKLRQLPAVNLTPEEDK